MPANHQSGLKLGDPASRCGGCAWYNSNAPEKNCVAARADGTPITVDPSWQACELWERRIPSCDHCGACCREAFDSVPVSDEDLVRLENPESWIRLHSDGWRDLKRTPSPTGCGTRCAALFGTGRETEPFRCKVYATRPTNCRELDIGSEACLTARRRVRLSMWHPDQSPEGPWATATEYGDAEAPKLG